jgi:hypothetical protein
MKKNDIQNIIENLRKILSEAYENGIENYPELYISDKQEQLDFYCDLLDILENGKNWFNGML